MPINVPSIIAINTMTGTAFLSFLDTINIYRPIAPNSMQLGTVQKALFLDAVIA
jgi:hypothetical protein